MVLLLCIGCTRIDNNYNDIIDSVTKNNSNIYNTTALGYKYYLNRKEVLEAQKEFLKANENEIFKNFKNENIPVLWHDE